MDNKDFYVKQGKDNGSPDRNNSIKDIPLDSADFIIPGEDYNKPETVSREEPGYGAAAYDDIMIVEDFDNEAAHYARSKEDGFSLKSKSEIKDAHSIGINKKSENEDDENTGEPKENFFKRHKIPVIITSACLAAVCVIGGVLFALFANGILPNPFEDKSGSIVNAQGEFTYLDGISVSGIDISGMTFEEAKALLEENTDKFRKPFNLTVEANKVEYKLTQDNFEYTYNIEETLKRAKRYCQDVSDGKIKPTQPTADETGAKNSLLNVSASVTQESVDSVCNEIADKTDVPAENAKVSKFHPFEKDKFEFSEGKNGVSTDRKDLSGAVKAFVIAGKSQGVVSAKIDTAQPKINVDMVKQNIVPLSSFSTTSYNTENGTSNMATALNACNGSVIEPGATWSFNECTGNSNLESNGYKSAAVINEGKTEQGIGGGICQASTTIYNAAIFANMEIAERSCHYWASSYAASGLDATIDYPRLDLKLKNNTEYQMFFECRVEGRKLICNIYGYQDPSYDDIATYSENYNISDSSYNAKAYRVYYKDGTEVGREELPGSHYSLSDGHSVQRADSGTHLVKPDGTSMQKNTEETTTEARNNERDEGNDEPQVIDSPGSSSSSSAPPEDEPTEPPTEPPAPTEAPTVPDVTSGNEE